MKRILSTVFLLSSVLVAPVAHCADVFVDATPVVAEAKVKAAKTTKQRVKLVVRYAVPALVALSAAGLTYNHWNIARLADDKKPTEGVRLWVKTNITDRLVALNTQKTRQGWKRGAAITGVVTAEAVVALTVALLFDHLTVDEQKSLVVKVYEYLTKKDQKSQRAVLRVS